MVLYLKIRLRYASMASQRVSTFQYPSINTNPTLIVIRRQILDPLFDQSLEPDHLKFKDFLYRMISLLNKYSLAKIKEGELKLGQIILLQCMEWLKDFTLDQQMTSLLNEIYNHIACSYRRDGRLKLSLEAIWKANRIPNNKEKGLGYLNQCAVYL